MRVAGVLFPTIIILSCTSAEAQKVGGQWLNSAITPCGRLSLPKGAIRVKSRGMVINFKCDAFYHLIGPKMMSCIERKFRPSQFPVCIAPGCPEPEPIENGWWKAELRMSILKVTCDANFETHDKYPIVCDGRNWNATLPQCYPKNPALVCDLDSESLCGWEQGSTESDDWTFQSKANPCRANGTGPEQDDSVDGKGKYLYVDNSMALENKTSARLYSPVYAKSAENCFSFSYHMFGSDNLGVIRVYTVEAGQEVSSTTLPEAKITGDQGDAWRKFYFFTSMLKSFQWVIEAEIDNPNISVIAIDNMQLKNSKCPSDVPKNNSIAIPSCKYRCKRYPERYLNSSSCSCSVDCLTSDNCCSDYEKYCNLSDLEASTEEVTTPLTTPPPTTTPSTTPAVRTTTPTTKPSTWIVRSTSPIFRTTVATAKTTRKIWLNATEPPRRTTLKSTKTTPTTKVTPTKLRTTSTTLPTTKFVAQTTVKITTQTTPFVATTESSSVMEHAKFPEDIAKKAPRTSVSSIIGFLFGCVVGVAILLLVVKVAGDLIRKRASQLRGDGQEVAFLAQDSDEPQLDFSLATPDNVKTFTHHERL